MTKNNDVGLASADIVQFLFDNTTSRSPLRKVFVRLFLRLGSYELELHLNIDMLSLYPPGFLALTLNKAMARLTETSCKMLIGSENFH